MIDWIDKLPDSLTGAVVAAGLWFGANYAILAERAMAKDHAVAALSCVAALQRHERGLQLAPTGLGTVLGMPGLDQIEREVLKLAKPRLLSDGERRDLCACALKAAARGLRFEYAVHTASFRIIEPSALAGLGTGTIGVVMSGACGAIPSRRKLG
jgi:hypothetical protein